jgi:two-component system sensor histidine kinase BaeS
VSEGTDRRVTATVSIRISPTDDIAPTQQSAEPADVRGTGVVAHRLDHGPRSAPLSAPDAASARARRISARRRAARASRLATLAGHAHRGHVRARRAAAPPEPASDAGPVSRIAVPPARTSSRPAVPLRLGIGRPLSMRLHVIAAMMALALGTVAFTGLATRRGVDGELATLGQRELQASAAGLATAAAIGYDGTGGWSEPWVRRLLRTAPRDAGRLAVMGADGRPVAGSPAAPARAGARAPVTVGGRRVGTVVAAAPGDTGAEQFGARVRERVDDRLLEAGIAAGVLALLLALGLGLRLVRPLHRLTDVARRLEHGEIETRATGAGGPRETAELAHTLDRLAAALRRQDELRRSTVHDVVHELRNGLVGVVGRLEALQDGVVSDPEAALNRTARDAQRLNRLVDDVLLLAEAQKPGLLVNKRPLRLDELALERAGAHADRFAGHGIDFAFEAAPASVDGDPERLGQIVDNLLSNALRYTDPGGSVRLRLDVRGRDAVLQVADTGIGIAPEHLGRIFDRFWRDPAARDRVADGSGVGLALVRDLVIAHDGRVEAESRPGRGSTFSVIIPLAVAAHAEEPLVREPALECERDGGGHAVDLWRLRGEIDTANAARIEGELIEAVSGGTVDVVLDLTDVAFIDSSGLGSLVAVAAEVRSRGGHLAIVAVAPHVTRVFELLELDDVMDLARTRRDAMARIDARARRRHTSAAAAA